MENVQVICPVDYQVLRGGGPCEVGFHVAWPGPGPCSFDFWRDGEDVPAFGGEIPAEENGQVWEFGIDVTPGLYRVDFYAADSPGDVASVGVFVVQRENAPAAGRSRMNEHEPSWPSPVQVNDSVAEYPAASLRDYWLAVRMGYENECSPGVETDFQGEYWGGVFLVDLWALSPADDGLCQQNQWFKIAELTLNTTRPWPCGTMRPWEIQGFPPVWRFSAPHPWAGRAVWSRVEFVGMSGCLWGPLCAEPWVGESSQPMPVGSWISRSVRNSDAGALAVGREPSLGVGECVPADALPSPGTDDSLGPRVDGLLGLLDAVPDAGEKGPQAFGAKIDLPSGFGVGLETTVVEVPLGITSDVLPKMDGFGAIGGWMDSQRGLVRAVGGVMVVGLFLLATWRALSTTKQKSGGV